MLWTRIAAASLGAMLLIASNWAPAAASDPAAPEFAQAQPPARTAPRPGPRDLAIQAFFGTFSGTGMARSEDSAYFGVTVRDLDVKIAAAGSGFLATWTTVLRSGGDPARPRVRRRTQTLSFEPADRPGLFRGTESGDPLQGKPLAWARIQRNTLYIHSLELGEDGAYDFETYARTLSGSGMDLLYTRVRDGEQMRSVKGKLIKNAN